MIFSTVDQKPGFLFSCVLRCRSDGRPDIAKMLKTCYFPGKEKVDLVMNFFDADEKGEVNTLPN